MAQEHPNTLHVTAEMRYHLERLQKAARDHGFDLVGFLFKVINYQQEDENYVLEAFSAKPAPIPAMIAQMEAALCIMREQLPANVDMREEEKMMAEAIEGKLKTPLSEIDPSKIN